jgi:hypothetical protein
MAVYIEQFNVDRFRGINDLVIESINHVNIIAGDNNSGKTSILEAMLLLRNPMDITNVLRIARLRDASVFSSGVSIYESFINLFPRDAEETSIGINSLCNAGTVFYRLIGAQKRIMLDPEDVFRRLPFSQRHRAKQDYFSDAVETDAFIGEIQFEHGNINKTVNVDINAFATASGREIKRNNFLDMYYLSPFNHVQGNVFNKIVRNDGYKDICLHVLRLIDADIADLLILRNDGSNRPVEYVRHAKLGNMPLSTYGDGIKKILSIANGIAQAAGGVLMIDEVETAIHPRYYNDIFRFIVKACKQFEVQVFITTHSLEVIDGLLDTQDYNMQSDWDDVSIITFKKESGDRRTYSRVLPGRKVHANRERFGFEVRL